MPRDYSRDPDTSPGGPPSWWDDLGETKKPAPYSAKSWAYTQTAIVEQDSCSDRPDGSLDCTNEDPEWWETLGGTLRPYATASWSYIQESDVILELFLAVEFKIFDEREFSGERGGVILDNGVFGTTPVIVYDEAEWNSSGQRVYTVNRTFAEISVYDSFASSPGNVPSIIEPLGDLSTDPPASTSFVMSDGSPDFNFIELGATSTSQNDKPPGTMLARVSYEIFGSIARIMSWNHYNWEDDTPVRKACEVLIRELPDSVTEITVEDDPTPFWVSLGFEQAVKGDPVLHYYR